MSTAMRERRKEPRLQEQFRAVVTLFEKTRDPEIESRTFFCSTKNISCGGLRLTSSEHIPVGTKLDLLIVLTWCFWGFTHSGLVVWSEADKKNNTCTLGIKLTTTSEATRIAWRDAIDDKLGQDETATG